MTQIKADKRISMNVSFSAEHGARRTEHGFSAEHGALCTEHGESTGTPATGAPAHASVTADSLTEHREPSTEHLPSPTPNPVQTTLPIGILFPRPDQPRRDSRENLDTLVASIRARGLLQPLRVLEIRPGREYEIIAGERRWRAAKEAGLKEVPVVVVRGQDRNEAYIDSFVENIERADLNSIERARALQKIKVHLVDFTWDQILKSGRIGINRAQLFYLLGLLSLPEPMQGDIASGLLSEKHGRALRSLRKHPELQNQAWQYLRAMKLSGEEAIAYVNKLKDKAPTLHDLHMKYRDRDDLIEQLEAKLVELRAEVERAPRRAQRHSQHNGTAVPRPQRLGGDLRPSA